ncbi:NAD-dependent epimerase/dehydratase family protein [Spirosoma gilvum]
MKTILGTGQLGIAILDTLLQKNPTEKILLVNRKGKLDRALPDNVQTIAADVTNSHDMKAIAQKSEILFSCTDVPYQQWEEFYPAVASALAHALQNSQAKLVFADNLYSYGNVAGEPMHEEMSHKARTKKGKIRASVINTLLKSGDDFNNQVAFVKAADFIGPRIYKGVFGEDFLNKLYQQKTILLFGKAGLPHTFTYITDFAKAMINVGEATDTYKQIWHVPNAPAINLMEWVTLFEAESKRKSKVMVLPKIIVWIAGLFDSLVKEFYELAYQFEYPYLVNHNKYTARFGNHATSPATIVKETVDWYKTTL